MKRDTNFESGGELGDNDLQTRLLSKRIYPMQPTWPWDQNNSEILSIFLVENHRSASAGSYKQEI